MNVNDTYLIQIKLKEQVLFQDTINLPSNNQSNYTVAARNFPIINGGILTASLYKLSKTFDTFYKSRPVTPANNTNGTNSTNDTTTPAIIPPDFSTIA